jgi:hypothetical protein
MPSKAKGFGHDAHVKVPTIVSIQVDGQRMYLCNSLIPVWVQSTLDDGCSVDLLPVHRDNREWIRDSEDIPLDKRVRSDDCRLEGRVRSRWIMDSSDR